MASASSKILAVRLKELRRQRGLSAAELARRCRISYRQYLGTEAGWHDPWMSMLGRLAQFYKIEVWQLLTATKASRGTGRKRRAKTVKP